jgi:hypothetical protein
VKKFIAYILILVFVTSSSLELYQDLHELAKMAVNMPESADDSSKAEPEKEDTAKYKMLHDYNVTVAGLMVTQQYYLSHLFKLPKPACPIDIKPPETV